MYITTRFPHPPSPDASANGLGGEPSESSSSVQSTGRFGLSRRSQSGGKGGQPMSLTREQFCPDAQGAVLRALVVALQQGDSLVRRTALDLLVDCFPLPTTDPPPIASPNKAENATGRKASESKATVVAPTAGGGWADAEPLFSDANFTELLCAALSLLPLREWSLTRRVRLWVFAAQVRA